jgi:hypothetical protein
MVRASEGNIGSIDTVEKFLLLDVRRVEVPLQMAFLDFPIHKLAHPIACQNLSNLRGQLLGPP